MPAAFESWKPLPHDPMTPLADNLWSVVGEVPGMALRRRMTVARTNDGRLVIHNAVALGDEAMEELEGLGPIAVIVVPNGWHRLDAPNFKRRYPDARIICPPGSRKRVQQVVTVDGRLTECTDVAPITFEHLEGTKNIEGVMRVDSEDGVTLVFNDVLFNQPHLPGFGGLMMRLMGSSGGPKVTRIARLFMAKNKPALRAQLLRLADTPNLTRLIPGHGDIVSREPARILQEVAKGL